MTHDPSAASNDSPVRVWTPRDRWNALVGRIGEREVVASGSWNDTVQIRAERRQTTTVLGLLGPDAGGRQ